VLRLVYYDQQLIMMPVARAQPRGGPDVYVLSPLRHGEDGGREQAKPSPSPRHGPTQRPGCRRPSPPRRNSRARHSSGRGRPNAGWRSALGPDRPSRWPPCA
jgi:hypothetical protein